MSDSGAGTIKKKSRLEIFSWCMFDFANSSYTTVIITAIFAPVFTNIIVPSSEYSENPYSMGNSLWALALGISCLLTAILSPLLGAITDISASKKKFLFTSYLGCCIFTASLWFVESQDYFILAFIIIIFSNILFSAGENFISSFLPFLAPKEEQGKVSGYAWGFGYFGGLISVVIVRLLIGDSIAANYENLRLIGPLTALFFLLAGIPTFIFLNEPNIAKVKTSKMPSIRQSYTKIVSNIKSLLEFRELLYFLSALFFALAALYIVIAFTFIYGKQEIGLSSNEEIIVFFLVNIFAALGAFLFGFLQDKYSPLRIFKIILILWIISAIFLFYLKDTLFYINFIFGTSTSLSTLFIIFASLCGMGLGGLQPMSRTIVSLFSPKDRAGEFFGLWGVSSKIAAAFGVFSLAVLQSLFGLHNAIISLVVFFGIALIICFLVNEKEGFKKALAE